MYAKSKGSALTLSMHQQMREVPERIYTRSSVCPGMQFAPVHQVQRSMSFVAVIVIFFCLWSVNSLI